MKEKKEYDTWLMPKNPIKMWELTSLLKISFKDRLRFCLQSCYKNLEIKQEKKK